MTSAATPSRASASPNRRSTTYQGLGRGGSMKSTASSTLSRTKRSLLSPPATTTDHTGRRACAQALGYFAGPAHSRGPLSLLRRGQLRDRPDRAGLRRLRQEAVLTPACGAA